MAEIAIFCKCFALLGDVLDWGRGTADTKMLLGEIKKQASPNDTYISSVSIANILKNNRKAE